MSSCRSRRILVLLVGLLAPGAARAQRPAPLAPGAPFSERIAPGQLRTFAVDLAAGRFVYGVADQKDVDLVVTVKDPAGRELGTFDGPARGPERFTFSSEAAGRYTIELRPFGDSAGAYTVVLERIEPVATTPEGRVDQILAPYTGERTPGAAVAVFRDGRIVFEKGYGMADLEAGAPVTPRTVFHVASVSKQFTAYAIALLAGEGKLSLDDDVQKHLPEVPDFGRPITLRHLLHHTSGLRDQWALWAMAGGRMDDVITEDDLLWLITHQRELNFTPGAEYLYSNSGFTLLAKVVERVSGEPFPAFARERLFAPLGMTSTQVYDDHQRLVPGRAYSYEPDGRGGWEKSVLSYANYGATSLFTTVEDLARWLQNYDQPKVGTGATVRLMEERGVLNKGDTIPYALGIVVDTLRGLRRLEHGGADAGYRSDVAFFPELHAGVVVLANAADFDAGGTARRVAEAFWGDRMGPPPPRRPQPSRKPAAPAAKAAPADLAALVGRYYSPELEAFYTISLEGGKLVARSRRSGAIALEPAGPDELDGNAWYFQKVRVQRDAAGKVTGIRVSNGRVRNLLFEKQAGS